VRVGRLLSAALLAATLAGCASEQSPGLLAGGSRVEVDTPELRALKNDAGIEACPSAQGDPAVDGLPDVTLPCLGGGDDVDLARLRGPLVVNVWASWCPPCREELPVYQRFAEQYAGRVAVLGIDFNDTQPRAALELARDSGVTYPLVADPDSDVEGPPPGLVQRGLPMVVLVDADGRVVHREAREVTSVAELEELVATHLGVRP
jgi:thiol-disulfide isomerase/thioredoxin